MSDTEPRMREQLATLKLVAVAEQYAALATEAAQKQWSHVDYLARLIDSEAQRRHQLAIERRIASARLPWIKTLDQFDWNWPKKINRTQVQNLFRLAFLKDKANIIFLGGVGLGKTHLASALAHEACLRGHSVLFTTAVDIINTLTAAQTVGRLKHELKRYLKPAILAVDELGYLPIDKTGADLLFQVISQRYEQGSIVLTTNQPYKHWPKVFNNDSTLTSAVLDRLLHHAEPGLALSSVLSSAVDSRCVVESPEGVLWFGGGGAGGRIKRLQDGQVREYPESVGNLFGIAFDPFGTIWLGTEGGLWEARDDHIVRPQGIEGESFGIINCLLMDREGNLWIGTEDHGLYCLYHKPFHIYTTQDGLASDDVWSITQARDGSLWVATKAGASRMAGGQFATFRVPGREDDGIRNDLRVITEDPAGTIWAGMRNGALVVSGSELVTPKDSRLQRFLFSSAYGNSHGTFWLVGDNGGMVSFEHGIWKGRTIDLPGTEVLHLLGILQDSYGDLWVGSSEHGLFHVQKDKTTRVTQSDGLSSNMVGPVLADGDGTLWLASNKGLNRLKNGRITRYTTAEGLAEDIVLNVLEDGSGWFWLNGHRGIHRVRRQQLEDLAAGRLPFLDCISYGLEDGLLSVEGNGGTFPNSCKTADGRLWFPTTRGLAVVDPKMGHSYALAPPILIESLRGDGELVYDNVSASLDGITSVNLTNNETELQSPPKPRSPIVSRELRLRPGHADSLLFSFTANTFPRNVQVRFRYRLEGRDPQWIDLDTQASALVNHLPPGHYRFHVTACNSHGVWNSTGSELAFYVAPFFYQTWTFYGICVAVILLGIGAFETFRHSTQRRILSLEKEAALNRERERIARDLHDDLGASLSRIAVLSEVAQQKLETHSQAGPQITRISAIAHQVVDSISELVWATNSKYDNLESLAAYLREYAAQFFDSTQVECQLNFPSHLPEQVLTAEFRRQLFLVLKEALYNVARHAQASRVEISLAVQPGWLEIVIQDNGKGMVARETPGFHHGLTNMRERVANLHGTFDLQSNPDQGTCVLIRVPLSKA